MDNKQPYNTKLNIPHIYVSPAEAHDNKLKQSQSTITLSKEGELFDQELNQFDFDNINLPTESLDFIPNDKYSFNENLESSNIPNVNILNTDAYDDDIKSFYSALDEISGLNAIPANNQAESFINKELFGLNDENTEPLQTTLSLPKMEKIKSTNSNNSNHLSISRVNTREGRSKSVTKSNATRSRSRSRTRSISNLSNKDEAVLVDALRHVNLIESERNNSNLLAVDENEGDFLSDASDSDILSILSEFENRNDFLEYESLDDNVDINASAADDSEKKHVCKFCNFAFLRNHDLDRHMASHLNRKNYPCKGFVLGNLPQTAMNYLQREYDLKMNPSAFDLDVLKKNIMYVERNPLTVSWGCSKEFLRSDSLSRHLKSKTEDRCMKVAYNDFINGNVFSHYRFLKLKDLVLPDSFKVQNDDNKLDISEKFIQAETLIKDMDMSLLKSEAWPISQETFETKYKKTYGKNLQKYIQRQAKLKKMAEKDIKSISIE